MPLGVLLLSGQNTPPGDLEGYMKDLPARRVCGCLVTPLVFHYRLRQSPEGVIPTPQRLLILPVPFGEL